MMNERKGFHLLRFSCSRNKGFPLCLDDFALPLPPPLPRPSPSIPPFYVPPWVSVVSRGWAGGRCWQLFWALNRIGGKVLAHVAGSRPARICGEPARRRSYESRTCVNTVVGCHPGGQGGGREERISFLAARNGPEKNPRDSTLAGDNTCPICERRCGGHISQSNAGAALTSEILETRGRDDRPARFRGEKAKFR